MNWWVWVILGLGLFLLELLTPGGFYMVFFAAGAVAAGLFAGLQAESELWAQVLVFVGVSILSLLMFRRKLVEKFQVSSSGKESSGQFTGENAFPMEDLAPGGTGKAEMRGTSWTAKNGTEQKLKKGQRCQVEKVEGLTLWLRPE